MTSDKCLLQKMVPNRNEMSVKMSETQAAMNRSQW